MFATLLHHDRTHPHTVPDAPASGTLDPRPRSCLTLPAPFPPRRLPSQPCSCPCPCAFPPSFSVPMPFGRPSLAKCTVVPQPKHLCLLRTSSACPASPSLLICLCIHVEGFLVVLFLVWVACLVDHAIPFVVQVAVPTAEEVVLPGSCFVAEEYLQVLPSWEVWSLDCTSSDSGAFVFLASKPTASLLLGMKRMSPVF